MTITIPTGDLTGILADVLPFAFSDPEVPTLNSIRLEWDAGMLHALSTDRIRAAVSSWHPDDDPEPGAIAEDDLFTTWGGSDEPWHLLLTRDDVVHLVKVFKLPRKESHVPLTVEVHEGQVTVRRHRDTGYSALTATMDHQLVEDAPDIRALLAGIGPARRVDHVCYNARFLADFGKVRPRGHPLALTFAGPGRATRITIGERFAGAIQPASEPKDPH
jgi:hypothetical protein